MLDTKGKTRKNKPCIVKHCDILIFKKFMKHRNMMFNFSRMFEMSMKNCTFSNISYLIKRGFKLLLCCGWQSNRSNENSFAKKPDMLLSELTNESSNQLLVTWYDAFYMYVFMSSRYDAFYLYDVMIFHYDVFYFYDVMISRYDALHLHDVMISRYVAFCVYYMMI